MQYGMNWVWLLFSQLVRISSSLTYTFIEYVNQNWNQKAADRAYLLSKIQEDTGRLRGRYKK